MRYPTAQKQDPWGLFLAAFIPFIVGLPYIPVKVTFGDGAELLTAMMNLGVTHPSGYPLFTLLGAFFSHLPAPSEMYSVVFWLALLPVVLTSMLLYKMGRLVDVDPLWALFASLIWVFSRPVLKMMTRIEVYPLHTLLVVIAFWAMLRYLRAPDRIKWAYIAVTAVGLGLTNHLTAVFLVPSIGLGLCLAGGRNILNVRRIVSFIAIGLTCGLLYLYLPLASMGAADGHTVAWGTTHTWDGFLSHVRGDDYATFRKLENIPNGFVKFNRNLHLNIFPGWWLIGLVGLFEWLRKRAIFGIASLLFLTLTTTYVASYSIGDIGTYYPPIYAIIAVLAGAGLNLTAKLRIGSGPIGRAIPSVVAVVLLLILFVTQADQQRGKQYDGVLAADMGRLAVEEVPKGSIIFTNTDAHTFAVWYQTYTQHPSGRVIHIDLRSSTHSWYRDHLRARYPDVNWPPDAAMKVNRKLIKKLRQLNPDLRQFALENKPWDFKGTVGVLRGWTHELFDARAPYKEQSTYWVRHHFISKFRQVNGIRRIYDSDSTFKVGQDDVICAVEWHANHPEMSIEWELIPPSGDSTTSKIDSVPGPNTWTDTIIPAAVQRAGVWTCIARASGQPETRIQFEFVE